MVRISSQKFTSGKIHHLDLPKLFSHQKNCTFRYLGAEGVAARDSRNCAVSSPASRRESRRRRASWVDGVEGLNSQEGNLHLEVLQEPESNSTWTWRISLKSVNLSH